MDISNISKNLVAGIDEWAQSLRVYTTKFDSKTLTTVGDISSRKLFPDDNCAIDKIDFRIFRRNGKAADACALITYFCDLRCAYVDHVTDEYDVLKCITSSKENALKLFDEHLKTRREELIAECMQKKEELESKIKRLQEIIV